MIVTITQKSIFAGKIVTVERFTKVLSTMEITISVQIVITKIKKLKTFLT